MTEGAYFNDPGQERREGRTRRYYSDQHAETQLNLQNMQKLKVPNMLLSKYLLQSASSAKFVAEDLFRSVVTNNASSIDATRFVRDG
jgi:hypothetical protein